MRKKVRYLATAIFKFSIVPTCLCLQFSLAHAQVNLTVTGRILDRETQQPIEYASMGVHGETLSSIANSDGEFVFHLPAQHLTDSIRFSHIGYENASYCVKDLLEKNKVILLQAKTIYLTEIVITNKQTTFADEIVEQAIKQIDKNYPNETFVLKAYFRKYQKIDGTYVSFLDAAVQLYDDQYTTKVKNKPPQAVLVEAVRKSNYLNFKPFRSWIDQISEDSNWLARLLKSDDIRHQNGLLDKKNKFELKGHTYFNNELCYEVEVVQLPWRWLKTNENSKITLIVSSKDHKIYRIRHDEMVDPITVDPYLWKKQTNDTIVSRISGGSKVLEFKELNGKLYLNSFRETSHVEDYNIKTKKIEFRNEYSWELQVLEVKENLEEDLAKDFNFENTRDNFKVLGKPYDPSFWKSYNVIPFTQEMRKAFKDLSKITPIEKQFSQSKQ